MQHGSHQEFQVFLGVTKCLLAIQQGFFGFDRLGLTFHFIQLHADGVNPLLVGLGGAELIFQLIVVDDAAGFHVDQEHLAGLQAPLLHDLAFWNWQCARFRSHHDQVVFGHDVTRRAQAVAVKRSANLLAIGEGHGGGAVPGFHHGGVVFIEGTTVVVHQGVLFPGFRHHHHHGLGNRVAGHHQQFQTVVETGGVRLTFENQGVQLLQIVAQHGAFHDAFASAHPVEVAFHGVDFTVVGQHAIRVGQRPLGEGVGGEALVNQCQCRHAACFFQVEVVLANLVGQQQALVHNGTSAHGGAEVFSAVRQVQVLDGVHGALANYIQFAFQCVGHHDVAATADKHLANHGFFQAHGGAHGHIGIHRHITPAQQHLALGFHGTLNFLLAGNARCGFFGQEQHADTVFTGGWQGNALLGHFFTEESIGNLNQDTSAVAHQWVGTHGTAVVQVFQNFQAALDNLVGTLAFDVRHKANATGVVFVAGGVHAFFFGNLSNVLLHGKAPDFSTLVTLLQRGKILKENKRGLTLFKSPHQNKGILNRDIRNKPMYFLHLVGALVLYCWTSARPGANRSIRKLLNLRAKSIIAPKPPLAQAF